jgi:predicted nucleic acid-binding protein
MPPLYLLDTNAVSDVMADHPNIKAKIASQPGRLVTSVVVRGEILYGIERLPAGKRRSDLKTKADVVLATLPSEPVTDPAADIYATIRRAVELLGVALDDNDLWIASTALAIGAVLITRGKDFGQIPGLQVEDWTR